jgi:hypothetical protein
MSKKSSENFLSGLGDLSDDPPEDVPDERCVGGSQKETASKDGGEGEFLKPIDQSSSSPLPAISTGLSQKKTMKPIEFFNIIMADHQVYGVPGKRGQTPDMIMKPQQTRKFSLITSRETDRALVTTKLNGWRVSIHFTRKNGLPVVLVKQANGEVIQILSEYYFNLSALPEQLFDIGAILLGEVYCTVSTDEGDLLVGHTGIPSSLDMLKRTWGRSDLSGGFSVRVGVFGLYCLGIQLGEGTIYGANFTNPGTQLAFCMKILQNQPKYIHVVDIYMIYIKDGIAYENVECTEFKCRFEELKDKLLEKLPSQKEGYVLHIKGPLKTEKCGKGNSRDLRSVKIKPCLGGVFRVVREKYEGYQIFDCRGQVGYISSNHSYILQNLRLQPTDDCYAFLEFTWASHDKRTITGVHQAGASALRLKSERLCNLEEVLDANRHFGSVMNALAKLREVKDSVEIGLRQPQKWISRTSDTDLQGAAGGSASSQSSLKRKWT